MPWKSLVSLAATVVVLAAAEPPALQGEAMLKTDLLFVGAHPDDETGVASTLARYAALGKTVACVYATRGEGGGNMVGTQSGAALGVLREAELRACLQTLGVRFVYFLDEEDFFYTESLVATLDKWDKQDVLSKLVRLVRSLRPEVIVTMNPAPNPGQHGHHQAAGVLAVEAFTAAALPGAYIDQLDREGLSTWQPKKLYFGGGGDNAVKISTDEKLPNGKVPGDVAAEALSHHRSQAFGNIGNSPWLRRPQSFLLALSAVPRVSGEQDLFTGVDGRLVTPPAAPPVMAPALEFRPRHAITRFREWAAIHNLGHLFRNFPADLPVLAGRVNSIEYRGEAESHSMTEAGWIVLGSDGDRVQVQVPVDARRDADLTLRSRKGAEATVRLHPVPVIGVSRVGNEAAMRHEIGMNLVVQGRAESPTDSSGTFSVSYDQQFLYIDVNVLDDVLVSNIEANDIKGHWRSDSVEICIDPDAGSEHTMKSFKIGVFPFDASGQVRAARDADAKQGPVERTAPDVKLASKKTADGYQISVGVPWRDIGVRPRKGQMLGFNVIIYDGDKKGAAPGENINESRLAWAPRPGVQGRPEDWGRIVLE